MPRDYNINISVGGGDRRGAFSGGNVYRNRNTLNSSMYNNNEEPSRFGNYNLRKVFNLGLAFNTFQKGNELLGAFTQNRLRQKRIDNAMLFGKYAIGIAINPLAGGAYALSDLAYRGISYGIKLQQGNREAEYYRGLSGNNSNSGSRYRRDYV